MLKLKWRHFFGQFTSVHSSRDWDLDHLPRIFAFARGTLRSTATALNTPKMKQLLIASILLTLAACQGPTTTEPQEEPQGTSQTPTSLPGQGEDAGKTVIYRDTYGVPHIYAPTVEAGLYAQGWAQAEDRPTQLLVNLKIALGKLTEIQGEEGVQTSLISHMFGHMRNATRSVANMSESELRRVRAFANGITDYYKAHPEDVPEWWRHEAITPAMIDAFGRMFLYNWSIDEAFTDLFHGGIEIPVIFHSAYSDAIGPTRRQKDNKKARNQGLEQWIETRFGRRRFVDQWSTGAYTQEHPEGHNTENRESGQLQPTSLVVGKSLVGILGSRRATTRTRACGDGYQSGFDNTVRDIPNHRQEHECHGKDEPGVPGDVGIPGGQNGLGRGLGDAEQQESLGMGHTPMRLGGVCPVFHANQLEPISTRSASRAAAPSLFSLP